MTRVLFLDIDGVLNSEVHYNRKIGPGGHVLDRPVNAVEDDQLATLLARFPGTDRGRWLHYLRCIDPLCVGRLNAIVAATGAQVVLSSAWRRILALEQMQAVLDAHGFIGKLVDATPRNLRGHNGGTYVPRGVEIMHWIENSAPNGLEAFAILDDNGGMDGCEDRFVQTDFEVGLADIDVERAIQLLTELRP